MSDHSGKLNWDGATRQRHWPCKWLSLQNIWQPFKKWCALSEEALAFYTQIRSLNVSCPGAGEPCVMCLSQAENNSQRRIHLRPIQWEFLWPTENFRVTCFITTTMYLLPNLDPVASWESSGKSSSKFSIISLWKLKIGKTLGETTLCFCRLFQGHH